MWTIIENQLKGARRDREFYTRITGEEAIAWNDRVRIRSGILTWAMPTHRGSD